MTACADPPAERAEVLYLVRSWPRLSQTFILDEVLGMQRLGRPVRVVALERSHDGLVQRELAELATPVDYLPATVGLRSTLAAHLRIALRSPRRYLRACRAAAGQRRADRGYHVATSVRCLSMATRLAARIRTGARGHRVCHIHAHFAHDPAAVAHLTHLLTGVPWSFTAHARDLWQVPGPVLAERARSARFVVTCSRPGADHISALAPDLRERVRLIHHGVDVEAFRPSPRRVAVSEPPLVVSIGRLVEKKGLDDLVDACRLLAERGNQLRCVVYGDGPMRDALAARIDGHGLDGAVTLAGERTRAELRAVLAHSDVFVLTPYVTADGDRDGIPNVVVEAMACGLPVLATSTGGIPELVLDGVNGLLVPPRDVTAITDRLETLLTDPVLRRRLGAAARRTVVDGFDVRTGVGALEAMFPGGAR